MPIGGIRTSATSEVTMDPKAAPMMMPTAMSRTDPRMANSLNSLNMLTSWERFRPLYIERLAELSIMGDRKRGDPQAGAAHGDEPDLLDRAGRGGRAGRHRADHPPLLRPTGDPARPGQ